MGIKISDIAQLAGVSKSAVSLALNEKPGISISTRKKIIKIAHQQGYTPLRKKRQDIQNNLGAVAFLVVTTTGVVKSNYRTLPFFNSLISCLSAEISAVNGSLKTITITQTELSQQLSSIRETADSFLVLGTDLTKKSAALINQRLKHVVFLDTYFEDINADFVTMDNYQGARLAGEYILRKGYRQIGYFASDKIMSNFSERRRGFRAILKEAGVTISNDNFYFISPTETNPNGLNMTRFINKLPKAIFCEDDYIALRLLKVARQAKITIPDQLAIMGFDDIYESTLVSPELSTIHVPIEQIAHEALKQLIDQYLHPQRLPLKILVATKLVERQSL
ncbi:LacI family DNA-binding transcriptional regulator [Lactiplantibacillus paraplantarum]|uniref:LacI family DNA-binding transcriptional regulator n=1 Tax=Lactiplantibacillus paraplantarum TaxID=60520 RepID=UPI003DA581F7